jgi:hypothetical protein
MSDGTGILEYSDFYPLRNFFCFFVAAIDRNIPKFVYRLENQSLRGSASPEVSVF